MIIDSIICGLSISAILFVFYQTGAFPEYIRLLGLGRLFKVNEYYRNKQNIEELDLKPEFANYIEFLQVDYGQKFITKLFICPTCHAFWWSLAAGFIVGFKYVFLVYFIVLLSYYSLAVLARKSH